MYCYLGIATPKQDVVIYRQYCHDEGIVDFKSFVEAAVKRNDASPMSFVQVGSRRCHYILREGLYYLLCSGGPEPDETVSSVMAVEFLEGFHRLIKTFCGSASEESVRRNLLLVEEIAAEAMKHGYVVTTEPSGLRPYVYGEPVESKSAENVFSTFGLALQPAAESETGAEAAARPAFSSRRPQKERQKGEVFVDVLERLCATVTKEGRVSNFELSGALTLRCCLDTQVDVTLGLNENLVLREEGASTDAYTTDLEPDSYVLNESVKRRESEPRNVFVVRAPQGEVTLMKYLITRVPQNGLPFTVRTAVTEIADSRDLDLTMCVRCEANPGAEAVNVAVLLPIPRRVTSFMKQLGQSNQTAVHDANARRIVWKIAKLSAKSEALAKFRLVDANYGEASRLQIGPLALEFELSNHSTSGLNVRYLKLDPNLACRRWVRCVTTSNSVVFRLA